MAARASLPELDSKTRKAFDNAVPLPTNGASVASGKDVMPSQTFSVDMTRTADKLRLSNPVEKLEQAHRMAMQLARFQEGSVLRSIGFTYRVSKERGESGGFGYVYDAVQVESGRFVWIKTEPMTDNPTMKRFKTLRMELVVLQKCLQAPPAQAEHFIKLLDSGCTDNFKFLVLNPVGDNLYTVTRITLNSAFSKSTALRVSIQMLRSLVDLHALGFVHRFLKPHVFVHGKGLQVKSVLLADFSLAFAFRDKDDRVRKPRRKVKIQGAIRYTSLHSHLQQELGRRDDLESWAYLSMEFFYLNVLPWRGDQIAASVLYKKQKLFNGEYPRVYQKVPPEFGTILKYIQGLRYSDTPDYQFIMDQLELIRRNHNIDFGVPYDWERATTPPPAPPPPPAPATSGSRKLVLPRTEATLKTANGTEQEPEKKDSSRGQPQELKHLSAEKEPTAQQSSGTEEQSSGSMEVEKFHAKAHVAVDDLIDVSISTASRREPCAHLEQKLRHPQGVQWKRSMSSTTNEQNVEQEKRYHKSG